LGRCPQKKNTAPSRLPLLQPLLLLAIAALCFFSHSPLLLKLYPVLVNLLLLATFGYSLFRPPSVAFRFALLADKLKKPPHKIEGSLGEKHVAAYCQKVTLAWCLFFVLNATLSALTVFALSPAAWALYNGGISYILMGTLFAMEWAIRKMTDKTIPKATPLSAFAPSSRKADTVLGYSGSFSMGKHQTWADFLAGTGALREVLAAAPQRRWVLYCNDAWHFLLAYAALLQCNKEVLLSAHISPAYVAEMAEGAQGDTALLCDEEGVLGLLPGSVFVPSILQGGPPPPWGTEGVPPIEADARNIVIYTSGTTGKPKAVRHSLRELEADNAFVLSKWGGELLSRKLCSTLSPHHIYGLLFSIMLPFTAGIPLRRERIEYPEIFGQLVDEAYCIVSVPAFLKRAVELAPREGGGFGLRAPWVVSSGGAIPLEVAAEVERVLGVWPVEIYGSTETAGIAWRNSKAGPGWTPFEGVQFWQNEEGCWGLKSPSTGGEGVLMGDWVEWLPQGGFLLKGRVDSVVKIEEKRISLVEVENRLMLSNFVEEAAVLALSGKRQFLAAAVVLSAAGKKHFANRNKLCINTHLRQHLQPFFENTLIPKRWRYVEALPKNAQGKRPKQEVEALFAGPYAPPLIPPSLVGEAPPSLPRVLLLPHGLSANLVEYTVDSAVVEFALPESSPYFDGHFPGFKILPAVAQVELVYACAKQLFGSQEAGFSIRSARRIKFMARVAPEAKLRLELEFEVPVGEARLWGLVRFVLKSPGGEVVYSTGSLACGAWGGEL